MKDPCIALDVSKGKSHCQGFITQDEPVGRAIRIMHDRIGLENLMSLKNTILERHSRVVFVFEATGIYHKSIQSYLDEQHESYIILSPLEAAKIRKSRLRSTKTDVKDCRSIAEAYFLRDYSIHGKLDERDEKARTLNRHYGFIVWQIKHLKIRFRSVLDLVFPRFDLLYENPYRSIPFTLLKHYRHPRFIKGKRIGTIAKTLMKGTTHREAFCLAEAKKILSYAQRTQSGCRPEQQEVIILRNLVLELEEKMKEAQTILDDLEACVKDNEVYKRLMTMPGVAINLASRITAEIGNINRFGHKKQLVAYAGTDPKIYQSGQKTGDHLPITKKGNKCLRTLFYMAARAAIGSKKPNSIKRFYESKTTQVTPLERNAAIIASSNKMMHILFSLCKNHQDYRNRI
jgi:transposase